MSEASRDNGEIVASAVQIERCGKKSAIAGHAA